MYEYISHFLILLVFFLYGPNRKYAQIFWRSSRTSSFPTPTARKAKYSTSKWKATITGIVDLHNNIHCFYMYQAFIFRACYCNCLDILLSSRTAIPEKSLLPRPSRLIPPPPVSPTRLGWQRVGVGVFVVAEKDVFVFCFWFSGSGLVVVAEVVVTVSPLLEYFNGCGGSSSVWRIK